MRWLTRMFFRTLRAILGPFMLLWEWMTAPKGIVRPAGQQQQVDEATKSLTLYEFRTCPFCIKVRHEIRHLSLNIERRDARKNALHREQLIHGGGRLKVPCLRIVNEDGDVEWLYESDDIIAWLRRRFS